MAPFTTPASRWRGLKTAGYVSPWLPVAVSTAPMSVSWLSLCCPAALVGLESLLYLFGLDLGLFFSVLGGLVARLGNPSVVSSVRVYLGQLGVCSKPTYFLALPVLVSRECWAPSGPLLVVNASGSVTHFCVHQASFIFNGEICEALTNSTDVTHTPCVTTCLLRYQILCLWIWKR